MKLPESDPQGRERSQTGSLAQPGGPIFGSHPTAMLRRRNGIDDFPVDPPPHLPDPPPALTAPDFAMQFVPCLESIPVPDGTDLRANVIQAVKASVGQNADVRYVCMEGSGRIGVWLRPAGTGHVSQFREKSMRLIKVLDGDENLAVWVNASYIRAEATKDFSAGPLRLDHDGNEQADGPVHLTGIDVKFYESGKVVTSVTGFDETPFPDMGFTLSITDAFSVSGSRLIVESTTNLDTDTSWIDVLTGAFFALGVFVSPWFFVGALGFGAERVYIATVDPGDRGGGAGAIAAKNIPKEIYLKGSEKVVCQYNRVTINQGGIVAGGSSFVAARIPSCSVVGPADIAVPVRATTVSSVYQVNTDDMRGNLNIHWSGGGTVSRQGHGSTLISFDTTGLKPGHSIEKFVHVSVTDADGLTAEAQETVSLHMVSDNDNLPPVCRQKPWLPQCRA